MITYEMWEQTIPDAIKTDPVWQFYAYRKALFLYDLMWEDCESLVRDPRGRAVAEQLTRSADSISQYRGGLWSRLREGSRSFPADFDRLCPREPRLVLPCEMLARP